MRYAAWVALAGVLLAACGAQKPEPGSGARTASARAERVSGPLIGCVTTGPETCFDATDNNCNGVIDEGCGVETGPVQFIIAWEAPKADVDLLVTDPAGELAEVGRALASGLTKQRDCPGRSDECRGRNLENVYLNGPEALRGHYGVRVVLESLGGESPPIRVRLGARVGAQTYGEELLLERVEAVHERAFDL